MATRKISSKATWKKNGKNPQMELARLSGDLGPDEIRILVRVARRLWVGKERYGPMKVSGDRRDFQKEASEELLDWLVYTEMDLERKAQKKARRRIRT